jgi:hypothetical protein
MGHAALTAYLEQKGLADTDNVRVRARYTRCPTCAAPVLTGLDAAVAGLPRICDVVDLDQVAEFAALLAGRATFTVLELPDGLRLACRHQWAIAGPRQTRPVVAEHACGQPAPASTVFRWSIPASSAPTDAPPF